MAGCGYAVLLLGVVSTTPWARSTAAARHGSRLASPAFGEPGPGQRLRPGGNIETESSHVGT
jgi:hypothetical protein